MVTIAVIPCYNEQNTIASIIYKCLAYVDEVVVADDQSTDNTATVAFGAMAKVIRTNGKHGPGKAYRTGISFALMRGADIIVTLDGDGQHNPDEIPKLLKELEHHDMVITSRFMDGLTHMPFYRKVGIWLITTAYNLGAKFKVKDSQCGLRAAYAHVFYDLNLTENEFGYSTEMLVKARAKAYSIAEIPTIVKYHDNFSNNSSLNPLLHGIEVMLCTSKWRIKCEF